LWNTGLTYGENTIPRFPYETKEQSERNKSRRGKRTIQIHPRHTAAVCSSQEQEQQFHLFTTGQHFTAKDM
jgi:hypothetical protein